MPTKPCRSGHLSKRYVKGGSCYECEVTRYWGWSGLTEAEAKNSIPTCVYVFVAGEYAKVGIAEDVVSRFQVTKTHCPIPVRIAYTTEPMPRRLARSVEVHVSEVLADMATSGEWYRCSEDDAKEAISAALEVLAKPPAQMELVA